MKSKYLLLILIVLFYACKSEKKKQPRAIKKYTINQFMDNESVSSGSFSTDNSKILVSSNRTGIYNVYSTTPKGGELTPLPNLTLPLILPVLISLRMTEY